MLMTRNTLKNIKWWHLTRMFCDSNRGGTWGSIWGIIRIGCRGCTRGGTFGDTVSGTCGSTSSRGVIRGGTSWDAQDCH